MTPPQPPKPMRMLYLLAAALCLAGGLLGCALGLLAVTGTVSAMQTGFLIAFEVLVVIAGFFGLLAGLGRLPEGPNLAIFCMAGALVIAGLLIEPALMQRLRGVQASATSIAGLSLMPLAAAQLALGLLCVPLSALGTLSAGPRQARAMFVRGLILGLPVLAGLALVAFLLTGRGRSMLAGLPPFVVALAIVLGMILLGGLLSASLHFVINAFIEAQRHKEHD